MEIGPLDGEIHKFISIDKMEKTGPAPVYTTFGAIYHDT